MWLRESSLRAFTWCASRFLAPTGRLFRHFHPFVDHHDLSQLAIEEDEAGNPIVKFAHHSNRRFSDKVARDTSDVTGATITDIDCIFGWNEQERERSMQQHYAGLDLASRIERLARVTMMV